MGIGGGSIFRFTPHRASQEDFSEAGRQTFYNYDENPLEEKDDSDYYVKNPVCVL